MRANNTIYFAVRASIPIVCYLKGLNINTPIYNREVEKTQRTPTFYFSATI